MFFTKRKQPGSQAKQLVKVLVIPCQKLLLAVPITEAVKVVRIPEIYRSGQRALGLANFDDKEVIVIDLHQKIYNLPNPEVEQYLIVIQPNKGCLFGIPSSSLPTLANLPEQEMKELPRDYRDRDALGIASHIVTLSQSEQSQTILLLDILRIFETFQPQAN